ncbi:MAG TPA: YbaB/EbfC family nucleoid-associated protein [Terracidiphilus sp.]|jgi:DNA-binding YbaB/EbfC family protein|nr:YbaB/EbfC family nucleoid-associated protein [Terracidiphilus sp.]
MFNPLKLSEMLSQAGQMQEEMQRKLSETIVEASSGGGAVTATMNGKKELLKLHIDPSAALSLSGGQADVEMLEDLIVGAVNEAGRKADEAIKSNVQGMLGGLKIPGLT